VQRRIPIRSGIRVVVLMALSIIGCGKDNLILNSAVSDVKAGCTLAVERLGQAAGDLQLRSVWAEMDLHASGPTVGKLRYGFGTRKAPARHCFVTFDNRSLRCSMDWGEGPGPEPFGDRSINIANVVLGIQDALRIAGERGGTTILDGLQRKDAQIELLLSPGEQRAMMGGHPLHPCVWAVSYDVWGNSGPQGFLKIEIDAATGDLVDVIDHRMKATEAEQKP
jgi:hypothetical protein